MSQEEWMMVVAMLAMVIGFMVIYRLAPSPPDWHEYKDKRTKKQKKASAKALPTRRKRLAVPDLGPLRGYESFIAGKPRPVAGAAVRRHRKQHLIDWDDEAKRLFKEGE